MREGKKRSFLQLRKGMTIEELKKLCIKVAKEYAESDGIFSYRYFTEKYNISKSCFYEVLKSAVLYNWVDDKTSRKMEAKAIANQKAKMPSAGATSISNYAELRKKRDDLIVAMYTDKEIEDIAEEFAFNTEITKQELANKHGVTIRVIDMVLEKAIVEAIIVDSTYTALVDRTIQKIQNSGDREKLEEAKKFFDGLDKKRWKTISRMLPE